MRKAELRGAIAKRVEEAHQLAPHDRPDDLVGMDTRPEIPSWHSHEHQVWRVGEEIRQLMAKQTKLRRDVELQEAFVEIGTDRRFGRGRQPFIMLLGYRACAVQAPAIAAIVGDPEVQGHAINTLYKMRARGYSNLIERGLGSPATWICKAARRYVEWDRTPAS